MIGLREAFRKAGFRSRQHFSEATGLPIETISLAMKALPIQRADAERIRTILDRHHIDINDVEITIIGDEELARESKISLQQIITELGYSSQLEFAKALDLAPSTISMAIHQAISPDTAREILRRIKERTGREYAPNHMSWKIEKQHSRLLRPLDALPERPSLRDIQSFLQIKTQQEFAKSININIRQISPAMQFRPIEQRWMEKIVQELREKYGLDLRIDQIRWIEDEAPAE